jgi:hypothetical protein
MPKFISIQYGAYLLNVAYITSIGVNVGDDGAVTDYEVFVNDGNGPYTVDDPDEMAKLMTLIEVA